MSGNIVPRKFEYGLTLEPYVYDPQKAKQLLKDAGYATGFDAGEVSKEKSFKHLAFQGRGAFGNAASRLDAFAYSKGAQSWIQDAEIDQWYEVQAKERDRQKRAVLLHKIQQKLYDEARFIPIWELGFLCASGPRAAVSGLRAIPLFAYSGPYEDVQLRP